MSPCFADLAACACRELRARAVQLPHPIHQRGVGALDGHPLGARLLRGTRPDIHLGHNAPDGLQLLGHGAGVCVDDVCWHGRRLRPSDHVDCVGHRQPAADRGAGGAGGARPGGAERRRRRRGGGGAGAQR
eukprot:350426-Chlamydomonas_euryale.AAC.2